MHVWTKACLSALVLLLSACAQTPTSAPPQFPAPIDTLGQRDSDRSALRRAWIEAMHRAAPEDDWRQIDSDTLARKYEQRLQQGGGQASATRRQVDLGSGFSGRWVERGSDNQSGRVVGADYNPSSGELLVYAHGGQIWRAALDLLDWESLNDSVEFRPNGSGASFLRLPGQPDRLIVASDGPNGVFFSDDLGQSWAAASGLPAVNNWYAQGLVARTGSDEVYLLRNRYDFGSQSWRPELFASSNRGSSFSSLGFVGQRDQVALFAPRYDSSQVYLLVGRSLQRVVSGSQQRIELSTLPIGDQAIEGRRTLLTGGVTAQGSIFLYAILAQPGASDGNALVFRSLDGGQSWTERTPAPTRAFAFNSAVSSTRNPDIVMVGGIELFRSTNGGASWQRVNTWQSYYSQPATRLHADIPNIDVFREGGGERWFISTDGGVYDSTDAVATVRNLSLQGLRISQYYGSYTLRQPPHAIIAGSQDQGYQLAALPGSGIENFNQVISGDYGHLVSGDGGASLWSVYPGFVMYDLQPSTPTQAGLRSWDYGAANFSDWLFLAPLAAIPGQPDRVLLAGGRIGAGSSHRIIELRWTGSSFVASQSSTDFGSQITAIAVDPFDTQRRYAMTRARRFFRSQDGGLSWSETASNLPAHQFLWGQRILPDPLTPGRLYVAGSGYSNPAVFVSTDFGANFQPHSAGLPSTLVFDLAKSADGQHFFAATEVGPYYWDRNSQQWRELSGPAGPAQRYWAVDWIEPLRIARFSTYGRGLWDLSVLDEQIFRSGFESLGPASAP